MIQVPDEVKELFKQDSIRKNFRVSFPNGEYSDLVNKDMVSESVTFTESVNSDDGLKFGLYEGSTLEFQTRFNKNIRNLKIYAEIEIDISSLGPKLEAELTSGRSYHGILHKNQNFEFEFEESSMFSSSTLYYTSSVLCLDGTSLVGPNGTIDSFSYGEFISYDDIVRRTIHDTSTTAVEVQLNFILSGDVGVTIYKNPYLDGVQVSDDVPYPYYPVSYGYFYVDSCKRDCANDIRKVVAYQNKYDNDMLLENDFDLTNFEKYKFFVTSVSNIAYEFNPLAAACSRYNTVDLLDGLCEYTHSTILDPSSTWSTAMYGPRISVNKNGTSGGYGIPIRLFYKLVTFTSTLTYNNNSFCPGIIRHVDASEQWTGPVVPHLDGSLLVPPDNNDLYKINYNSVPSDIDSFIEATLTDLHNYVLNNLPVDYHLEEDTFETASNYVRRLFRPHMLAMGKCPSCQVGDITEARALTYQYHYVIDSNYNIDQSISIDPTHQNGYDNPEDVGIFNWGSLTSGILLEMENGQCIIYPHTSGVTDRQNTYTQATMGCVGYVLCIPVKMEIYSPPGMQPVWDWSRTYSTDISIEEYTIRTNNPITQFSRAPISCKCKLACISGLAGGEKTISGKAYTALSSISNTNGKEIIESVLELQGMFGRFDRKSNVFKLLRLENDKNVLYPSSEIYPSQELYPHGSIHFISRSLRRSVWYEDKVTNYYNKVIATWTDTDDVKQSVCYTIVPDEEIVNPNDYQVYNLSDNYCIKNNCYTLEQITALVQNLGQIIENLQYHISDIEMRALPYLEAGDEIVVYTKEGGFSTFALRHRISGIQSLMDTIEAR